MKSWKDNVRFVLVEPEEPGNVGASARAMKNMGFRNLVLVNPPPLDEEARWFAHLALDVLDAAKAFPTLMEALAGMHVVVGATRRRGKQRGVFLPFEEGMQRAFALAGRNRVAVLFGREKKGLSNEETGRCDYLVSMPADREQPSLNLSHAVMVAAYELSRAGGAGAREKGPALVTRGELEVLYGRISALAGRLGFPSRGDRDIGKKTLLHLRRFIGRAGLTRAELHMLHGLCGQLERRLETHGKNQSD